MVKLAKEIGSAAPRYEVAGTEQFQMGRAASQSCPYSRFTELRGRSGLLCTGGQLELRVTPY